MLVWRHHPPPHAATLQSQYNLPYRGYLGIRRFCDSEAAASIQRCLKQLMEQRYPKTRRRVPQRRPYFKSLPLLSTALVPWVTSAKAGRSQAQPIAKIACSRRRSARSGVPALAARTSQKSCWLLTQESGATRRQAAGGRPSAPTSMHHGQLRRQSPAMSLAWVLGGV